MITSSSDNSSRANLGLFHLEAKRGAAGIDDATRGMPIINARSSSSLDFCWFVIAVRRLVRNCFVLRALSLLKMDCQENWDPYMKESTYEIHWLGNYPTRQTNIIIIAYSHEPEDNEWRSNVMLVLLLNSTRNQNSASRVASRLAMPVTSQLRAEGYTDAWTKVGTLPILYHQTTFDSGMWLIALTDQREVLLPRQDW